MRIGIIGACITGLTAASGLPLRRGEGTSAALGTDLLRRRRGRLRRGRDLAGQHGYAVRLEQVSGLILEKIHG